MKLHYGFTPNALQPILVILLVALSGTGLFAQVAAPVQTVVQTPAAFPGVIRLQLPPRLYAVPGIEMNVYFDNVCLVPNPMNVVFDVTCAKGRQQNERWTFVPAEEDVGDFPFVIEVRDATNMLIARAESILQIVPQKAGAGISVTVLTVGDSLTAAAVYPGHLLALCEADGNPKIALIGHVPRTNNPNIRIEGYGGWTAERFVTYYKAGERKDGDTWISSSSPFLYADAQEKVALDFARYCQEFNEGKGPDFVTFLLGCNDTFSATDDDIETRIDTVLTHYNKLLEMVRQVNKETKIGLLLLVPPAGTQDAFGANYTCGQTRWQYKRNQQRMVERMMETYGGRERDNIFLVPANVNLDCLHNYPLVKGPWNARTQEEGYRLNNGVHPSAEGYRQIGDTLFCWIKAQLR